MNINWDEKPEWAEVWLESVCDHVESGWRFSSIDDYFGEVWQTERGKFWAKRREGEGTYKIHYPPEAKPEWNGEGIPPVGTVCKGWLGDGWYKCEVLAHKESGVACYFPEFRDSGLKWIGRFRTIKSDKEKWIEQARALDCYPVEGMLSRSDFLSKVYDTLISGELPIPKQEK